MYCGNCGSKVEINSKFCPNCGAPLNNLENKQTNNKRKILIGIGCGLGGVCIILFLFFIIGKTNNYYFSNKSYDTTKPTTSSSPSTNSYTTAIVVDNVYHGVKIKNVKDANKLIVKDSVDQKNKCPKEMKEIENEFIKRFNLTAVNLCEMDLDFARELENVFEHIYNEYPMARGYITNLTLRNTSMLDGEVIAAFMPFYNFATADSATSYPWVIKTQVLLSSKFFLNKNMLDMATKESSATGHFPPNSNIYAPLAHELGHYVSFLAMINNHKFESVLLIDEKNVNKFYESVNDFGDGNFSLKMLQEAYSNYQKDTNSTLEFDDWRGTISKYALFKNNEGKYVYDETIAEAFHDVYINADKARDASKYIIQVLKKYLES